MGIKRSSIKKAPSQLKKLSFLIGKWHTEGLILQDVPDSSNEIRGMDTYEWIAGGFFILHRVDIFMGKERTEVIEIIGYDESRKSYFMKSFDNRGETITMYAVLEKPGVLKLGDKKMRSILTSKSGNSMIAKWELSENGKTWNPWMNIKLNK
ncbi:MAG TPA: DUF1579 family protein [Ferruginibacter sp.]|nr:DUF1579 family protein [Ferruginibacter sp.]